MFVLYRPWAPAARAQSVQVLHAAHALAAHREVEVWVRPSGPTAPEAVLDAYGLPVRPGLSLRVLPSNGAAASARFAWAMQRFARRTRRQGLWLSRQPRLAVRAHRLGGPQVTEAHGLWDDATAEAGALAAAVGVITNSPGTAERLRSRYPSLPPLTVVANAGRGAGPEPIGGGEGIGYVGSLRAGKGVTVLADLAARVDEPVVLVTPEADAARALSRRWRVEPAVAPREVPGRLARFRVLVLCLDHGPFGDAETCPLKWFDYQASGRPVVVADTPAMAWLAPAWVPRYRPGDVESLREALARCEDPSLVARFAAREGLRTWADRAREVHRFLAEVAP